MILVKPSHEILTKINSEEILGRLEYAGRICYKTEKKMRLWDVEQAKGFIGNILKSGHESVIEHENISIKIICDRGVTHEIVRHRLCAYSQESTRYCNYKGGVTFVIPPWNEMFRVVRHPLELDSLQMISDYTQHPTADEAWLVSMARAEETYKLLLNSNWSPQQARSVLPNSLKTEIVMTANIREWRHILRLRTSKAAHPQMQEVMVPILREFQAKIPILFDDISNVEGLDG